MTSTQRAKARFARYVEARKQFWWPQPQTQQPRMYLTPEMIGTRCPAKARKDWPADQTCMWRVE